jgi:hypothetical protein
MLYSNIFSHSIASKGKEGAILVGQWRYAVLAASGTTSLCHADDDAIVNWRGLLRQSRRMREQSECAAGCSCVRIAAGSFLLGLRRCV